MLQQFFFYSGVHDNPIVIIFSCPNQQCEIEHRPIQGRVFPNVKSVFKKLVARVGCGESVCGCIRGYDLCLRNVMVTNASCLEHPIKVGAATEPTMEEVEANAKRLWSEISNKKAVLCFGDRASHACDTAIAYGAVHEDKVKISKIVKCCHLCDQALAHIHAKDEKPVAKSRKIEALSEYLFEALQMVQRVVSMNDFRIFLEANDFSWRGRKGRGNDISTPRKRYK